MITRGAPAYSAILSSSSFTFRWDGFRFEGVDLEFEGVDLEFEGVDLGFLGFGVEFEGVDLEPRGFRLGTEGVNLEPKEVQIGVVLKKMAGLIEPPVRLEGCPALAPILVLFEGGTSSGRRFLVTSPDTFVVNSSSNTPLSGHKNKNKGLITDNSPS